MVRAILTVAMLVAMAVPVRADEPASVKSPTPIIRLAQVVDGKLTLEDHWATTQYVTETRTVTENGVSKTVNVAVPVKGLRSNREELALRDVKAFDMDGREVTRGRVEHVLRERTAVVISYDSGKLDPAFRRILRDDALLLVVPMPAVP